jgi:hypothetical protein
MRKPRVNESEKARRDDALKSMRMFADQRGLPLSYREEEFGHTVMFVMTMSGGHEFGIGYAKDRANT